MADNTLLNPGTGGDVIATDELVTLNSTASSGVKVQRVKVGHGSDGDFTDVSAANPLPVAGPLTDVQLRATALPVSFTWTGLTDAQLRASAVPVSLTWAGLTDAQLRASAVPVSFTWAGLTDAQLRASAVPVSLASAPLPTGAATEATLATLAAAAGVHDEVAVDGRSGIVVLVRRRDSDAEPMVADGDLTFLNIDEEGRLKVASKPASYPDITGNITAIQATIGTPVAGGTVSGDVSRASNVMAFCSGTFATVNCAFEGSLEPTGDSNWFSIQAVRSNANTIETATGNLSAQPLYAWEMSVNALARVRVRCTARTSGTQNWRFRLGTYATEPIPAAQVTATQPVSGTVGAVPSTVAGVIAEASSVKTASGNSAAALTNASGRNAYFIVNVSAASGTSPTLVVRVQVQDPISLTWVDLPDAATGTITGTGATLLSVSNLPRTFRLAWVIGGTTPSFTFSVGSLPVI